MKVYQIVWLMNDPIAVSFEPPEKWEKVMDEKLERDLLIGEINGYIEILNAKGIDSPIRDLKVLDTMSILDLRIITRRCRDMARTPSA